jgi:hypothetical protein
MFFSGKISSCAQYARVFYPNGGDSVDEMFLNVLSSQDLIEEKRRDHYNNFARKCLCKPLFEASESVKRSLKRAVGKAKFFISIL